MSYKVISSGTSSSALKNKTGCLISLVCGHRLQVGWHGSNRLINFIGKFYFDTIFMYPGAGCQKKKKVMLSIILSAMLL